MSLDAAPRVGAGGALPTPGIEAGAGVFNAAASATREGADVVSDEERQHAVKLRQIAEAKQGIINEVDATRRGADFEEFARSNAEEMQKQYWDNPEGALPAYQDTLGKQADTFITEPGINSEVSLQLSKLTSGAINQSMTRMHAWVEARQTQKAKADLSETVNRVAAGAEQLGTPEQLAQYLDQKSEQLKPTFYGIHGEDADAELAKMRNQATRAWALATSDKSPFTVMAALEDSNGPLASHLDAAQRESVRKDAKASFDGLEKQKEIDAIRTGLTHNKDFIESFLANPTDPKLGGAIYAAQQSIEEQRKAVNAGAAVDLAQAQKYGVDPAGLSRDELLGVLNDRARFFDALDKARRRQTPFDATDDVNSLAGLVQRQDAALKARNGKDLQSLLTQQGDLAVAVRDKKLSGPTATVMFRDLNLALSKAISNESSWHFELSNYFTSFQRPREAGWSELTGHPKFKSANPEIQTAAQVSFMHRFVQASDGGKVTVTPAVARKLARQALQGELGERINGAD
jgi:hypothetical protein